MADGGFFDPFGRLSASAYRRLLMRAMRVAAIVFCLAIWLAALGLRVAGLLVFAANLGVATHVLAGTARRLHDRDRSAVWIVAYALVYAATFAPIADAAESHPLAVIAGLVAMLGFFAWFFLETVVRSGTPGPNRFGAEPEPGKA